MMEDPDATILNTYDINVDDIIRKYGIALNLDQCASRSSSSNGKEGTCSPIVPTTSKTRLQVYDLSDSDTDEPKSPLKKLSKKENTKNQVSPNDKPKRKSPSPRADPAKKALLALQKAQRRQDVETKKLEAAKHKEIKKMLSEANKQLKPDECIKFITAIVDESITKNIDFDIESTFNELGSNYKIQSQMIPNTVTWTRMVHTHEIDDKSGSLKPITTVEELPDLLLILSAQDLFDFVKHDNLITHIKTIRSVYANKSVQLGVLRLDKQIKTLKGKNGLSYDDVMMALTELQNFCNCCYRNLSSPQDLAAMIGQFTKAIAQRPYKLQEQEKNAARSRYMQGDNTDCVKVDKKGNGLRRLWQQQITSFPLARLETAEAIIEKYPTVQSLMDAYYSEGIGERESLIADIAVRRSAGPSTSSRRIGIEMSKKFNVFFNSLDGDEPLC